MSTADLKARVPKLKEIETLVTQFETLSSTLVADLGTLDHVVANLKKLLEALQKIKAVLPDLHQVEEGITRL